MDKNKYLVNFSVCMATYNGEKFIAPQIESILSQIDINDELVISDDGSTDSTLDIISSYRDPRIKLLSNSGRCGPVLNFERAIFNSSGRIIFLCDQDDVWVHDKVSVINSCFFDPEILAVVSDARIVDSAGAVKVESYQIWRGVRQGFWRNLVKNGFLGCCMAFRNDTKQFLLPFPKNINMHDEWIGLCCSVAGRVSFIDRKLIDYRRHDGNVTNMHRGSIVFMLKKRVIFLMQILFRLPKVLLWHFRK